jgi:hypothetical protein
VGDFGRIWSLDDLLRPKSSRRSVPEFEIRPLAATEYSPEISETLLSVSIRAIGLWTGVQLSALTSLWAKLADDE